MRKLGAAESRRLRLGLARCYVIARQRHRIDFLGNLDLKHDRIFEAEGAFGSCEIEFPHPAEALVVKRRRLLPPGEKALAPMAQGLGIMQPQDFDVRHEQPRPFDRGHDLGKRGNIAAGENIFRHPGIGGRGGAFMTDRMEKRDALVVEQPGHLLEEGIIIADADMFEHADRNDAVEPRMDLTIVLEQKLRLRLESAIDRPLPRDTQLLARECYARDIGAADLCEIERHAAPTAADVEDALARLDEELCRDMALLGELRLVERCALALEIGAGILPILIEKKLIEPAVEIVMMRDIAARLGDMIALLEPPQSTAEPFHQAQPEELVEMSEIAGADR